MTEQITARGGAEALEGRRLCMWKDGGGTVACWREATERLIPSDPDYDVCSEHMRVFRLNRKVDELLYTLTTIGEWRRDTPACQEESPLEAHTADILQRAAEEYWKAAVSLFAAELMATQGPEETPLSVKEAERLAEPHLLSDTLTDAHITLEDLQGVPDAAFGKRGRWPMVAAIWMASNHASEEHSRVRAELREK